MAARCRLLEPLAHPLAFCINYVLKALVDIGKNGVEVVLFKYLLARCAQAVEKVEDARQALARPVVSPPLGHGTERRLHIAVGHELVGKMLQELLLADRERLVGPIPAGVAVRGHFSSYRGNGPPPCSD